jgi:nucleoid-associated protein YgaU
VSRRPSGWSEVAKSYANRSNEYARQRTWDDYIPPSKTKMRKMSVAELEEALYVALFQPKGAKQRKREALVAADRDAIEAMAKELKKQGVRCAKSMAEQARARGQNVTVAALRKRRYRKK